MERDFKLYWSKVGIRASRGIQEQCLVKLRETQV